MLSKKKLITVVSLAMVFCMVFTSVAMAAPGYIIGGVRYLSSDVAANPSLLQQLNAAIANYGLSSLIVDLGTDSNPLVFNYKDFIDAGGVNYQGGYQAYAAAHPATVPAGTQIIHPDGSKTPDPAAQPATVAITAVTAIADINVVNGTTLDKVGLPATVEVTKADGTKANVAVTWDGGTPAYSATTAGIYTFSGVLTMPQGLSNPNNLKASVKVVVAVADSTAPTITPSATSVNVTAANQAFTFTVADNDGGAGVDPTSIVVKQNGTALTATAVQGQANTYEVSLNEVKGANQTLTIDAKDKAGNAATTASVTLVDKTKPTLVSAQAPNNKTIAVTYSEPVAAGTGTNGALNVANYTLYNKASGQTVTFNAAAGVNNVQAVAAFATTDNTQVKLTILSVGNSVTGFPAGGLSDSNYILYVSNVNDRAPVANTIVPASPVQFAGTLTPDTAGANLVSATFNAGTGKVTLIFDKAVNNVAPADDKISFVVGANSVKLKNASDYNSFSVSGTTVEFTVDTTAGTGTLKKINDLGANPQIVLAAGAFTDGVNDSNAATITPTLVQPPVLNAVTYDEATNTAVFKFSKTIDVTKIVTVNGVFTIAGYPIANATLNNTSNSTDISIKLSDTDAQAVEAAARADADGIIAASVAAGTVQDTDATPNANVAASSSVNLTVGQGYTKDTTAPTFVSAKYNDDSKVLELTFSEALRATIGDFATDSIEFYKDDNGVAGLQTTAVNGVAADTKIATFADTDLLSATNDHAIIQNDFRTDATGATAAAADTEMKTLYIKDQNARTNKLQDSIDAAYAANKDVYVNIKANAVKDPSGNKIASDSSVKVTNVAVSNTSAVSTANSTITSTTVNSIVVTFKDSSGAFVAMDPATVTDITKYNLFLTSNPLNKPAIDKIIMGTNNTSATIILKDSAIAGQNYTLTTTGLKTAGGAAGDLTAKTFNAAAADAVTLASQSTVTTDVNNNGALDAGDTIKIPFNEEIKIPAGVTMANFTLDNNHSFGNSTFTLANDYKSITITIGSSSTAAAGDTITLPSNITDLEGNALGASSQAINKPATDAAPKIQSAVFTDTNADGAVGQGDTLVVTFDRDVKAAAGANLLDDFVIGGADSHAQNVVLSGNKATTTLKDEVDLSASNVKINSDSSKVNITSLWGTKALDPIGKAVTYTDTTAPTVTSIVYNSSTGQLTLNFDEAVHFSGTNGVSVAQMVYGKLSIDTTSSLGSKPTTAATLSSDKKAVTINLAGTPAIDSASVITISGGPFKADVDVDGKYEVIQDASGNAAIRAKASYTPTITN